MDDPDFYLASADSYHLEKPRRVWCIKRMSIPTRDDLLLVKVAPPITGEWRGSQTQSFDEALLATRHKGTSLFPITEWPVFVHVIRPLIDGIEGRDKLFDGEFENIGWAEAYKSEDDARQKLLPKD